MSSPNLLIRNLTNEVIILKTIERVQEQGSLGSRSTNPTTSTNGSSASEEKSSTHKEATEPQEQTVIDKYDIEIHPFGLQRIPTNTDIRLHNTSLRLIIHRGIDGHKLLLSKPSESQSTSLIPQSRSSPWQNLSAIYTASDSHLTILSSASVSNTASWMSGLPPSTPLSLLSIPGTHNSATHYKALPSVRCQVNDVATQLERGIRFLDIRLQIAYPKDPTRDTLILVHAVWSVSFANTKYFRPLLEQIESFLKANPTETVIVSLKREGAGTGTDEQFSSLLKRHYFDVNPDLWYTSPRIPALSEARGKIVVLRRFEMANEVKLLNDGLGIGLDAHAWRNNTAHGVRGHVCVQDMHLMPAVKGWEAKFEAVCRHLDRAGRMEGSASETDDSPHLYYDEFSSQPPGNDHMLPNTQQQNQHEGPSNPHKQPPSPNPRPKTAVEKATSRPLYLNFISASNFFKSSCWPDRIAARLNPVLLRYLTLNHGVHPGDKSIKPAEEDEEEELEKETRFSPSPTEENKDINQATPRNPIKAEGGNERSLKIRSADMCSGASSSTTGVVILDWVGADGDWDVVCVIVAMNEWLRGGVGGS